MATTTTFSLRDLGLSPGQHKQEQLTLPIAPYHQAGFDYVAEPPQVAALLDVDSMGTGLSFRLRFDAQMHGPCARCLEDAMVPVHVDAREVHEFGSDDPELTSDFVSDDQLQLDLAAWQQDALGLEFPARVLCQDDCRGLCAQCGANRNVTNCDCSQQSSDPRWDKLRELGLGKE